MKKSTINFLCYSLMMDLIDSCQELAEVTNKHASPLYYRNLVSSTRDFIKNFEHKDNKYLEQLLNDLLELIKEKEWCNL